MKILCGCGREPKFVDHADNGEQGEWEVYECRPCGLFFSITTRTLEQEALRCGWEEIEAFGRRAFKVPLGAPGQGYELRYPKNEEPSTIATDRISPHFGHNVVDLDEGRWRCLTCDPNDEGGEA